MKLVFAMVDKIRRLLQITAGKGAVWEVTSNQGLLLKQQLVLGNQSLLSRNLGRQYLDDLLSISVPESGTKRVLALFSR